MDTSKTGTDDNKGYKYKKRNKKSLTQEQLQGSIKRDSEYEDHIFGGTVRRKSERRIKSKSKCKSRTHFSDPNLNTRSKKHTPKRSKSEVLLRPDLKCKKLNEEKIKKIFGDDLVIDDSTPQFAPQPDHIRYYKIKKRFGEDIALEYVNEKGELSVCTKRELVGDFDDKNALHRSHRVQKFFGQTFDINEISCLARMSLTPKEEENGNQSIQPAHVDVSKLNKFFGRSTNIQKRNLEEQYKVEVLNRRRNTLDSSSSIPDIDVVFNLEQENPERNVLSNSETSDASPEYLRRSSSSESVLENYHKQVKLVHIKGYASDEDVCSYESWNIDKNSLRRKKKLKSIFGINLDVEKDKDAKQFASQPSNVKLFKLKKIFGNSVAVDYNEDPQVEDTSYNTMPSQVALKKSRKIKSFFGHSDNKDTKLKKKKKKRKLKKEISRLNLDT